MRRKFNWGNFVVLVIMIVSVSIILYDFSVMLMGIIKNTTATLTYFGFIFDFCYLIISIATYDYLFEN